MVKKAKAGKKPVKKTKKSVKRVTKHGTVEECRTLCDSSCGDDGQAFHAGMKEGLK